MTAKKTNMKYDYLIVGTGLFGATFAHQASLLGKRVLMLDKRAHIGGNVYTESQDGINVHVYGAHIFHTSNQKVWDYVNQFASFNHYVNRPKVSYKDNLYSFPINLMTLYQLWGVKTPQEAIKKLDAVKHDIPNPSNLEEWILSQVGSDIYEIFIKGYTTKQWQLPPSQLPSFIIKRLPIRLTFDDNYFNDTYQGIPIGGYTQIIEKMTAKADVKLNIDYFDDRSFWDAQAETILYTGPIDAFYDYEFGRLDYRTVKFEHETLDIPDFQGNAVINYTDEQVPFTRILEHKHFEFTQSDHTLITREYPDEWQPNKVPYYPLNNDANHKILAKYKQKAAIESNVLFGGRLAEYKYYDMHQVIASSLALSEKELGKSILATANTYR